MVVIHDHGEANFSFYRRRNYFKNQETYFNYIVQNNEGLGFTLYKNLLIKLSSYIRKSLEKFLLHPNNEQNGRYSSSISRLHTSKHLSKRLQAILVELNI